MSDTSKHDIVFPHGTRWNGLGPGPEASMSETRNPTVCLCGHRIDDQHQPVGFGGRGKCLCLGCDCTMPTTDAPVPTSEPSGQAALVGRAASVLVALSQEHDYAAKVQLLVHVLSTASPAPACASCAGKDEEIDKFRTCARVLCGGCIGVPQPKGCPVCRAEAAEVSLQTCRETLIAAEHAAGVYGTPVSLLDYIKAQP